MIYTTSLQGHTGQFGHQEVFLVCATSRRQYADSISVIAACHGLGETLLDLFISFFPRCFPKRAVIVLDQRLGQSSGTTHKTETVPTLGTQFAITDNVPPLGCNTQDLITFNIYVQATATPAIAARG